MFKRILACRAMLEEKVKAHEIMYGVNAGIGEFSEVVLNDEQVKDFQRYLIYNHAAGIVCLHAVEYVRAAMLAGLMFMLMVILAARFKYTSLS